VTERVTFAENYTSARLWAIRNLPFPQQYAQMLGKEGQPGLRDFFALRRKIAQIRPSPILSSCELAQIVVDFCSQFLTG
jgi:hypothetical protein